MVFTKCKLLNDGLLLEIIVNKVKQSNRLINIQCERPISLCQLQQKKSKKHFFCTKGLII